MLKILFIILFVFTLPAFSQTDNTPKAEKIDEFGTVTSGDAKARIDNLYALLTQSPNAKGFIINYGNKIDIAKRMRLFNKILLFRKYDARKFTFLKAFVSNQIETEFWIVPSGAKPPTLEK